MKKRIKIQGILIFLAVILFISFTRFTIPGWKTEFMEEFSDTLGVLLVLCGFLLRIIARGYKEEMTHGGNKLVIDGPYRLMRNPMYFGTLMIGTGIISVLLKLWTLPIFLIVFSLIYIPQINREEKKLLTKFGNDYAGYCKSSPKYFPNIRGLLDSRSYIYLPKLSWLIKELIPLLATLTAIFIIEIWEDVKLFGYRELFDEFWELLLTILIFIVIILIIARRPKLKERT